MDHLFWASQGILTEEERQAILEALTTKPETDTTTVIPPAIEQKKEWEGKWYQRAERNKPPREAVVDVESNNKAGDRVSKVVDGLGPLSPKVVPNAPGVTLSGYI